MKRIFFVLYLALFLSSCEDDINSPNYNNNDILGCPDPIACNFDPLADINDGSCIYGLSNSAECVAYDDCLNSNNIWTDHTCLDQDGLPFSNWDGSELGCGYLYQNAGFTFQDGGYTYQQAINDGEPCASLVQEACDEACTWNSDNEICELGYVCENDNGVALLGWDRESISAENDCNSASICINNSGDSLEGWNFSSNTQAECENYSVCLDNNGANWSSWDFSINTEDECNNEYQYNPGSCSVENSDSEDDGGADDGSTDDGGIDDGGTDDSGADDGGNG